MGFTVWVLPLKPKTHTQKTKFMGFIPKTQTQTRKTQKTKKIQKNLILGIHSHPKKTDTRIDGFHTQAQTHETQI
jgi:hypothetical protein